MVGTTNKADFGHRSGFTWVEERFARWLIHRLVYGSANWSSTPGSIVGPEARIQRVHVGCFWNADG